MAWILCFNSEARFLFPIVAFQILQILVFGIDHLELEMVKRFTCFVPAYDDFMRDELNGMSN